MSIDVVEPPALPALPKADPEMFALRARAPKTVRFRRGVIIGLTTAAIALVLGITGWALHPSVAQLGRDIRQNSATTAVKPTEMLNTAPSSYEELSKERPLQPANSTITPASPAVALGDGNGAAQNDTAMREAAESRQREAAAQATARSSPVLAQVAQPEQRLDEANGVGPNQNDKDSEATDASFASSTDADPNGQRRKDALLAASVPASASSAHALVAPASPWVISAGSVIAASLITGINSDLPGFASAQITENVYDSATGHSLLIPQGSRLIGKSDNVVSYGQKRALIVWQRLILPDGSSLQLDNLPASDEAGYVGLTDRVDAHGWALLKGVAVSTLLGISSELSSGSNDSDLARALRQSTESAADHAGQQLTSKTLDVQPTLEVRPGWPIRVIVHQDLVLRPWQESL